MFSKDEKKSRVNYLDSVYQNTHRALETLSGYEEKYGRDGFVISIHELLSGALDSLQSSLLALQASGTNCEQSPGDLVVEGPRRRPGMGGGIPRFEMEAGNPEFRIGRWDGDRHGELPAPEPDREEVPRGRR